MDVAFVCTATGGSARVNDDESVDVGWFPIRKLPDIPARHQKYVQRYLDGTEAAWFAQG